MSVEMINNRRVGISRKGAGTPMLMLHCALAHRGALAPLMAALPAQAFTAFDLPGHGESEFDTSVDIQAQAVETAVSLLEASGPSDVFGHSFGATVALKIALERPDLVRTLSLYEPVYFSVLAQTNPSAYAAEATASNSFTTAANAQDWPTAAQAFLARWGGDDLGALPPAQRSYILKTIPLILASKASIIVPESGEAVLAGIANLALPTLLIKGASSPVVISEIAHTLAQHGPSVKLETLADAGHMGPLTHVADVAALVAKHIA